MAKQEAFQLDKLEAAMRDALKEAQEHACPVHHAVVGCWLRAVERIKGKALDGAKRRELLAERDPELLCADGLDDAILGVLTRFGQEPIVVYDRAKVLAIIRADGGSEAEVEEHFAYNVIGSWVGDRTPAFVDLIETETP